MNLSAILDTTYKSNNGNLDDNQLVKNWSNNLKDKSLMIKAYLARDLYFHPQMTVSELFEKHLSKLGYNLTPEQMKVNRQYKFLKEIKIMVENEQIPDISFLKLYNDFINGPLSEKEKENINKTKIIRKSILMSGHPEEIYNYFSVEELEYLGW